MKVIMWALAQGCFPLFQRGAGGDLATFARATASEIPPNPPLKKGGIRAPNSLTTHANSAFEKGGSL